MKSIDIENVVVEERPDLLDMEKETYISFSTEDIKNGGCCKVCSHHKLIIDQLLTTEEAEYQRAYYHDDKLDYIEATIPLSHLKINSNGTDDNRLSRVVRN